MLKVNEQGSGHNVRVVTWLLAVYLFFAPLAFFPIVPGASILRFLSLLPLLALVFYIRSMNIRVDRYFLLPVFYTAFLFFTTTYSVSVGDSQVRAVSTATNIAFILFLAMINYNKNEIQVLRKAFIYSGWIAAILLSYAGAGYAPGRFAITLAGAAEDPNYSTGYMIFIMLYYLEQYLRHKKLRHLALFAVFIGLVFLTGSRGGLLAVLGASLFILVLWLHEQKIKLAATSMAIFVAGIIAVTVYFVFNNLPVELRGRFILSAELLRGTGRVIIWTSIIESFSVAPLINQLFGMGAATVRFFSHNWAVGHNIWLDSLIETGAIGTAILLTFYFAFLKKANNLKEHVVASAFFGYMLMALTMSLYSYRPIWNILLFILILKNATDKDGETKSSITQQTLCINK